jgi:hypothetical protein
MTRWSDAISSLLLSIYQLFKITRRTLHALFSPPLRIYLSAHRPPYIFLDTTTLFSTSQIFKSSWQPSMAVCLLASANLQTPGLIIYVLVLSAFSHIHISSAAASFCTNVDFLLKFSDIQNDSREFHVCLCLRVFKTRFEKLMFCFSFGFAHIYISSGAAFFCSTILTRV